MLRHTRSLRPGGWFLRRQLVDLASRSFLYAWLLSHSFLDSLAGCWLLLRMLPRRSHAALLIFRRIHVTQSKQLLLHSGRLSTVLSAPRRDWFRLRLWSQRVFAPRIGASEPLEMPLFIPTGTSQRTGNSAGGAVGPTELALDVRDFFRGVRSFAAANACKMSSTLSALVSLLTFFAFAAATALLLPRQHH